MSTYENPDAAPGADATSDEPVTVETQAIALPPVPELPAAESASAAETAPLADLTPPAFADQTTVLIPPEVATATDETAIRTDLTPPGAADETTVLADLEPPAPATLPPAFTGFAPAADATAPIAPAATAAVPAATASTVPSGPRVRWAGIVWGLVLAAIAALALWLLTDAGRQAAVTDWMLTLSPAAATAYGVLVVGAFALVAGLVGLVRRAQRAGERRRAASTSIV